MALSQSDLMRLLESLRTSDGVETIRVLCERILQELIEAEATEVIGAAPGEHSDKRTTWRNGHRERLLTTQAGDLDLGRRSGLRRRRPQVPVPHGAPSPVSS
ncbi:transposase [Streptomyces bobili]|uniref:transposase n=1 Tax=Streptomyces bobili TaxID=67280 RepID=UPI003669DCE7